MEYLTSLENPLFSQADKLEKGLDLTTALSLYLKITDHPQHQESIKTEAHLRVLWIAIELGFNELGLQTIQTLNQIELSVHQKVRKLIFEGEFVGKGGGLNQRSELFKQALEIAETHPTDCRDLMLYVYSSQANISSWSLAKDWIEKARPFLEYCTRTEDKIWFYIVEGWSEFQNREHSLHLFEKAKAYVSTHLEHPQAWLAKTILFEIRIHLFYSNIPDALKYCEEISELEVSVGASIPYYLTISKFSLLIGLNNIKGDYFEAIFYGKQAVAFINNNQHHPFPPIYHGLGMAYKNIGNHSLSLKHILKGFELFKKSNKDWKSEKFYNYLDNFYHRLGDAYSPINPEKADHYYELALDYGGKFEKDNRQLAGKWNARSSLFLNEKGIEYAKKAIELNEDFSSAFPAFLNLGNAYMAVGKLEEAQNAYTKALQANVLNSKKEQQVTPTAFDLKNEKLSYQFSDPIAAFAALCRLGEVHFKYFEDAGKPTNLKTSFAYFNYAKNLLRIIRTEFNPQSQIILNNQLSQYFSWYLKGLKASTSPDFDEILHVFQLCKSNNLKQIFTEKRIQEKYKDSSFIQEIKKQKIEIRQLEQQLAEMDKSEKKDNLYEVFFKKRQAYQAFFRQVEKEHPDYVKGNFQLRAYSLSDIQKNIGDEKIINYLISNQEIFILFIDKTESELICLPKPSYFDTSIDELWTAILQYNRISYQNKAQELYQLLIEPIADLLFDIFNADLIGNLTIIPSGILSKIPFATLFKKKQNNQPTYLIKSFNISYYYSASLWLENRIQKPREAVLNNKGFLGMAPIYEKKEATKQAAPSKRFDKETKEANGNSWQTLPYSKKEVEEIAKEFGQFKQPCLTLLHEAASKKNLLAHFNQYSYVHLAAHFHRDEIPQRSGLVLGNDSYLFVNDAYNLDLNNQLVVLSACESGIGEISDSEGMMAISRALLYAGIRNVVTCLFEINDELASEFMILFYQEILGEKSIKLALNEAKRKFIKRHPYHLRIWAAFTLYGID